jgi:hypothetical protein
MKYVECPHTFLSGTYFVLGTEKTKDIHGIQQREQRYEYERLGCENRKNRQFEGT